MAVIVVRVTLSASEIRQKGGGERERLKRKKRKGNERG